MELEKNLQQKIESMKVSHSSSYPDIILTEEETIEALHSAREFKHYELKRKEYAARLAEEPKYPFYETMEFERNILIKAKNEIPEFELNDFNKNVFDMLCLYFAKDIKFEESGMKLSKGILLYGNVGCGKTTLMNLFRMNQNQSFGVVSCRTVAQEFSIDGHGALETYSSLRRGAPNHFGQKYIGKCFDDLGTETVKKHFGNESNTMGDVLLNRYDNIKYNFTHLTTNLTKSDIEDVYGKRVLDRLIEMMNFISFPSTAKSLRK